MAVLPRFEWLDPAAAGIERDLPARSAVLPAAA
jgi:hypothetical protein